MPDMPMNFKCPQCGAGIRIGRHYCPQCGAKVDVQYDEIEKSVSKDDAFLRGERIGSWGRTTVTAMLFLGVVIFGVKDCYGPRPFVGDPNDFVTVTPPDVQSIANYKPEIVVTPYDVRSVDPKTKVTSAWPFAYRLDQAYRKDATEYRGGDFRKVNDLVVVGLNFLANEQQPDGSFPVNLYSQATKGRKIQWYPDTWEADIKAGAINDCTPIGATGLAALCFLGNGDLDIPQSNGVSRHRDVAGKAVKWLVAQQDPKTGAIGAKNAKWCVNHAQATMAVIEYYGLTKNRDGLEANCKSAIDFLLTMYNPTKGGFGYTQQMDQEPNLEATAWALLALADAREAGFDIPNADKIYSNTINLVASLRGVRDTVAFAPDKMGTAGAVRDWMGMYLTSVMLLSASDGGKDKDISAKDMTAPTFNTGWVIPWEMNQEPAKPSIDARGRELRPNDYFFATYGLRLYGGKKEWGLWQAAMLPVFDKWQDPNDHSYRSNDPLTKSRGLVWSSALNILALESYYRIP
ncbi:MAG TPA: zinc-ribbon domain-containing protein [Planctomycetota bacterium]|nr:zinc-ribbon domain-containing protein [Planctomycetota bacterium]